MIPLLVFSTSAPNFTLLTFSLQSSPLCLLPASAPPLVIAAQSFIMQLVTSDNDLPKSLNTPTKQVKRLKKLVLEHLGSASKRVDRPPMQGMYSRTCFVTLADSREVVVQFRTEQLDLDAFRLAREALGDVVPEATALADEELENEGAWAYSFNRLPGKIWVHGVAGKGAEGRIAVNKSLGRVFSRGCHVLSYAGPVK